MREKCWVALIPLVLMVTAAAADPPASALVAYQGLCNASAAVAIDGGRFLVADDEDKPKTFLRVYRVGHSEAATRGRKVDCLACCTDQTCCAINSILRGTAAR